MSPRHSRPVFPRARRRGFALIITISLLAFLVLLLVALASLTRVETTVAQNGQQLARARQNALFALQLAIGQLQETAGPDQRVTARADILDDVSDEAAHWTGVWHAHNPEAPDQHLDQDSNLRDWSLNTKKATWLVSSSPDNIPDPENYTPGANDALLARGIGTDPVDVRVPLVPINAAAPGVDGEPVVDRFAYWVSDEGVKAKANLVSPTFGQNDFALSQLHVASPHALPLQRIFALEGVDTDFRSTPVAELEKVLDPRTLPLLSTVPDEFDPKTYGPDITLHSRGVLADVRNGGLKRDLTAAFENPTQFATMANEHGYGSRAIYRSHPSAGLMPSSSVEDMGKFGAPAAGFPLPDGPLWYSLFYHYNGYKPTLTTPSGLGTSANAPTTTVDFEAPPYVLRPRSYRIDYPNTNLPTILHGIAPIVIAYRVDIALSSYQEGGLWKLRLQYHPQLVLHNPYSAQLSLSGFRVMKKINAFRFYQLKLTVGGTVVMHEIINPNGSKSISDQLDINQGPNGGRYDLATRNAHLNVLDPGETRVFTMAADEQKATVVLAGTFDTLSSVRVVPTASADHYQWVDIKGFEGTADGDTMVKMAVSHSAGTPLVGYMQHRLEPGTTVHWPSVNGASAGGERMFGVTAGYDVKPGDSEWTDRPISALETPVRVIGFFTRFKGLVPSANAADYKNGNRNIPLFHGNAGTLTVFEDEHSMQWQEVYLSQPGASYLSNITAINTTADGESTWGDQSVGEGTNPGAAVRRTVLRDVPAFPMVSLGQFMHAPFYRFSDRTGGANLSSMTFGSMFVGGSLASPIIPTDRLSVVYDWVTHIGKRLYTDDSFMANQALFDRFYFSTVPPATLTAHSPAYWKSFNNANPGPSVQDASVPFLNARMKVVASNGQPPLLADLRDSQKAAANLLRDGARNVTSTSVPAWRALLSALSGNRLRVWNATDGSSVTLDASNAKNVNPIPRFWSASATGTANEPWDGLRVLSDDEIDELAKRIVEQVKIRGPFLSMADFLNRRLGPAGPLTRAGALQAAIDNTSPDINAAAKALGVDVAVTGGTPGMVQDSLYDSKGAPLNTAVGIPGYLMQQDLVQAYSPVMTARSDTFVIRTRGDAVNPATGATEGRAWLEAVVQRTPAFVDQSDPKLAALGDATPLYAADGSANVNTNNLRFGRRFVVVSFRWLSENDL